MECSFPGCEAHPSKGDTIHRISAKGPGQPFIGRCEKHLGAEVPADLKAIEEAIHRGEVPDSAWAGGIKPDV
jgi:hypothetical protein